MAIVKFDPWREIEDMFDRYTRAISFPRKSTTGEIATIADWSPQVDIAETPKEFTIMAEIPEVKKEDVKVSIDSGVVTIQGERKQEKEEKDKKFHRIERFYGSFSRSFSLPDNIDANAAQATFKDGVLSLQIPKTAAAQPKAIEVKVA
ncbi:Hsp20/alpha crystallin family protein [Thiomonas delicata]|uniref:Related to low molecular weight heat shock protein (Hsp17) n=1 Tax=Thiomonas delicata TaxID=364030 RepID=A0A238D7P5_THIDL|nr:Hsp20/alpha crystallin family protein [Thiomonas delicata]SBP89343.1 Related to low molecular weight heat shock protein (Hsp17) [Thiomonas delicata]